ncbi:MAG: type II toxin-antitoxin system VapC family toxin [Deltaproteobacteria bacterium]|nr:type II toxin-antitoxin system VapC family toxin [Deltaproteobacteria bacterium]
MRYILDTDICIYILNDAAPQLRSYFEKWGPDQICISTLTEAELYYGALHSSKPKKNQEKIQKFVMPFPRIPFDSSAAFEFAAVKEELTRKGRPIGAVDMLIGAIAKAHGLILVSNNIKHFKLITGLKVENWLEE